MAGVQGEASVENFGTMEILNIKNPNSEDSKQPYCQPGLTWFLYCIDDMMTVDDMAGVKGEAGFEGVTGVDDKAGVEDMEGEGGVEGMAVVDDMAVVDGVEDIAGVEGSVFCSAPSFVPGSSAPFI